MALKVRHQPKPQGGITLSEIPQDVKDAVEAEWKHIQENPDHEAVFEDDTKAEVDLAFQYAGAYAKGRTPRLEIRRQTATNKQADTMIRFTIKLYDPEATRPGRPANR